MEEQSVSLQKRKSVEAHPCLSSKKALKALHLKSLEYTAERNVSYLDQADVTLLLGGTTEVKPNVVAEIMNQMVAQVMGTLPLY
jgi:D-arabinose 5-phosphate isomerase GutQ